MKRLVVFDFDGTLIDSPMPETGKSIWSKINGIPYPHKGWWGRPESLDLNVFDIKPFPKVLTRLNKEIATPNTYVIILTSRMGKLRTQVEAILTANNIHVDIVDMKRAESNKGVKILRYVRQFPELKVINVYDDRDTDIIAYEEIRSQIPIGIEFNIYVANNGKLVLTKSSSNCNFFEMIYNKIKKYYEFLYKICFNEK